MPGGLVQSTQVLPALPQWVGLVAVQLPPEQQPLQPTHPAQTPPSQPPVMQLPHWV
jgi:hypothetical protein